MPKISFIVPVYNTAPYLSRCLDSLLNQSVSEIEILAIDDGSKDSSPEILSQFQKDFPEKIFVYRKENGGLSDARNFGLDRARGDYIAFVDSDDFLSSDYAEKMLQKAETEDLDMVLCDFYYYYDSGEKIYSSVEKNLSDDPRRKALLSAPMACLRLFRRELFRDVRFQKGIFYEDLELTPGLVLKTEKIGFLSEALYFYYQRSASIMHQAAFSPKLLDIFSVLESIYSRFEKAEKAEEYQSELEFLYIEHLLRSAALRFAPLSNAKELFSKLCPAVENHFPHWQKNPYLPRVSLFFRLTVFLAKGGHFRCIRMLSKLKG